MNTMVDYQTTINLAIDLYKYINAKEFESLAIISMYHAVDVFKLQKFERVITSKEIKEPILSNISNEIYDIITKQLQSHNLLGASGDNSSSDNQKTPSEHLPEN
jgi:hypothetical protein